MRAHTQLLVSITIHLCTPILALNFISKERDLVLMHVPFNFGHTIEKIGLVPPEVTRDEFVQYIYSLGGFGEDARQATWEEVNKMLKPDGAVWGRFYPELQTKSNVTGCPLYLSPPKYWPEDLAKEYFGAKNIFGMLRDPKERLVAMFRNNNVAYGGGLDEYHRTCDVDGGIKQMMMDYLSGREKYGTGCTRIPQSEYFDGPYGIKIAVDNRRFPQSVEELFVSHGYDTEDWKIRPEDVMHVGSCDHIGTWNLTIDTKALILKAFPQDFKLLCQYFGHCDPFENVCIPGVESMCPTYINPAA